MILLVVACEVMLVPAQRFPGHRMPAASNHAEKLRHAVGSLRQPEPMVTPPRLARDVLDDTRPSEIRSPRRSLENKSEACRSQRSARGIPSGHSLSSSNPARQVRPPRRICHPARKSRDLLERGGVAPGVAPPNRVCRTPASRVFRCGPGHIVSPVQYFLQLPKETGAEHPGDWSREGGGTV